VPYVRLPRVDIGWGKAWTGTATDTRRTRRHRERHDRKHISGDGYTFDPDPVRQVVENWTDLAESYADSVTDARPMTTVGPPADGFVSESFAAKANASGTPTASSRIPAWRSLPIRPSR
jgi:hypothetical protein